MKRKKKYTKQDDDLLISFAETLLRNGHIDLSEIHDRDELKSAVITYLRQPNLEIEVIVNHLDSLLVSAKKMQISGNYNLAIVCYATYFEHSINGIINIKCSELKISNKAKNEIVRNINIRGKLTWLLELLQLPKFNKKHLDSILKLSEKRNAFIHYKWNPSKDENDNRAAITNILKSIAYMKRYESKIRFNRKKRVLDKTISKS